MSKISMEVTLQIEDGISPLNLLLEIKKLRIEDGGTGSTPCSRLARKFKYRSVLSFLNILKSTVPFKSFDEISRNERLTRLEIDFGIEP